MWTSSRKRESLSAGPTAPLASRLTRGPHGMPRRSTSSDRIEPERLARLAGVGARRALGQAHVAARVGGAAEADLVPRPRVRVERRRGRRASRPSTRSRRAAGPTRRPRARRRRRRATICALHRLVGEREALGAARRRGLVEALGDEPPGLAVVGHVDVLEAVEPPVVQLGVDEAHDRDPRLGVLGEHDVAERAQARELARG